MKNITAGEPIRNNKKVTDARLNLYWFALDQYSYTDEFIQHKGSDGFTWSPFLKLSPGYIRIRNDGPFIPEDRQAYYDASCRKTTRADFYGGAAMAGLACNIPVDAIMNYFEMGVPEGTHFYISPMADIGYSVYRSSYNGELGNRHGTEGYPTFDYRIEAGFSNKDFIAGAWVYDENQVCKIGNMLIQLANLQLTAFACVRF